MRTPISSGQFRRDVKLAQKRGKNMAKLRELILLLVEWSRHRDCHIEPDWLLIYKATDDDLYLVRTGTHSDLF